MTIKIDFVFETEHGKYADCLHLPDNHKFTDEEIQTMKEQRLNNWLAIVAAPPAPEPESNVKEIAGEVYQKLEGAPPSGAKLIEIDGVWYFKV